MQILAMPSTSVLIFSILVKNHQQYPCAHRSVNHSLYSGLQKLHSIEGNSPDHVNSPLSKKVFIVHGHDEGSREKVARFLERLGLEAIILHEQANRGRTVIEKVIEYGNVGFAVVLLTPDDEGCVKGGTLEPRARQNVLLELGFLLVTLDGIKSAPLKRSSRNTQ
ncbi:nucleotide-binding protein [Edwardsiella piscicida]|nr:nucleotide-binding protein [Edwardsiella piscicida]